MSDSPPLNLVLVHGAWHDDTTWERVVDAWNEPHVTLSAIRLPSVDGGGDLQRDAEALVEFCRGLAGPITVLGHSYGGAVMTQASARIDGLRALIYLAAMKPALGESVSSTARTALDANDLDQAIAVRDGQLLLDFDRARSALYDEEDSDDVAKLALSVHPQAVATFTQRLTSDTPSSVPTTYLVCSRDRAITPQLQRSMARSCAEVIEMSSGHSPHVNQPGQLIEMLEDAIRRHAPY